MTTRNHRIRFLIDNLANTDGATVTASSAQAGFPATNALNEKRHEPWMPAGNFTVDATNNKIYINDGSDKTVTLTSASYTYATLAAHIQTQLNASSTNWTCTYSTTTGKFTVGRSSGTALLKLATTTAAAWDMLGYTGAVDDDVGTGQAADERRNHTHEYFHVDFGAPVDFRAFAAFCSLAEVFALSSEATVKIQANSVDSWTSPPMDITLTPENIGAAAFMDDLEETEYRYARFWFEDRTNTVGPLGFSFAQLYFGSYLTVTRRNIVTGFDWTVVDPSDVLRSMGGAEYFIPRTPYCTFNSLSIVAVSAADRRALMSAFYRLGIHTPFILALDPTAIVSDSVIEKTKWVRFDSDAKFQHVKTDTYSFSFSVKEIEG